MQFVRRNGSESAGKGASVAAFADYQLCLFDLALSVDPRTEVNRRLYLYSRNYRCRIGSHSRNENPLQPRRDRSRYRSGIRSNGMRGMIVRYLRARFEIPTGRLSAAGFADGQPVAKNDSDEGRAMNRRVEIVVTNLKVAPK